ncbi:MAG TPA: tRNA pseudouridine(38-40) synthase TruA [Candidatus Brocadiia bacterium]|nr:tRNA pseudouridine(38-40) synthase TruA [Candidatus Brocadiia bacterium]
MTRQRNIKIVIEYDGTNYAGWQRQPDAATIQQSIEDAILSVTGAHSDVIGAGRTDAGVHAVGQVANFLTESGIPPASFREALNANLPSDIAVLSAEDTDHAFHARFSATGKLYRYSIINRRPRSPMSRFHAWHVPLSLDAGAMRDAAQCLAGTHDFAAFQAVGRPVKSSVRNVRQAEVEADGDMIVFSIAANGFLYRMVRNIVGTLVLVGHGKLDLQDFKKVFESLDRKKAGMTAPPQGLCLVSVSYDGKVRSDGQDDE